VPILYALTYPERRPARPRLDLARVGRLTFEGRHGPLSLLDPGRGRLAREAGPVVLNAANEITVAYLDRRIGFADIGLIDRALETWGSPELDRGVRRGRRRTRGGSGFVAGAGRAA
jgi:1-deoxy-D-xylulose 5-phosphate reductoisomerase